MRHLGGKGQEIVIVENRYDRKNYFVNEKDGTEPVERRIHHETWLDVEDLQARLPEELLDRVEREEPQMRAVQEPFVPVAPCAAQ